MEYDQQTKGISPLHSANSAPLRFNFSFKTKRGTERSEIDLSEAKAPQGDRRRAGSNAEGAEKDAERKILS